MSNASHLVDVLVERLRPVAEDVWGETRGSRELLHDMLDELLGRETEEAVQRGGDPAVFAASSLVAHLLGRAAAI